MTTDADRVKPLGDEQAREPLHLTEYEIQVLLGCSIYGCTMSPDRVFSLHLAWNRLCAIGLIDRADGLAIVTDRGRAVIASILAALAPAPQAADAGEALRIERDEAQSLCTAWQHVFQGIEAHLQDRVAMDDRSSPATYLSIIRSSVARVIEDSKRISAARWADYKRSRDRIEELEAASPVPEGWVLVPKEPTEDQLLAAMEAHDLQEFGEPDEYRAEFIRTYRAMLAAALEGNGNV